MENLLWSALLETQSCNTRFDIKIYTNLYTIQIENVSLVEYFNGSYNIYANDPFVFVLDNFTLFSFDSNNLSAVLNPHKKSCLFFAFDSQKIIKICFDFQFLTIKESI